MLERRSLVREPPPSAPAPPLSTPARWTLATWLVLNCVQWVLELVVR